MSCFQPVTLCACLLHLHISVLAESPSDDVRFEKVLSAPTEFSDNFSHAAIAASTAHKAIVGRNYIRVGSTEKIRWLRDNPERRGNRLFILDSDHPKVVHLPDSTRFGFIPNSPLLFVVVHGEVRLWDIEKRKQLETTLPHDLATENSGPNPAVSPDGKVIVTQTNYALHFWDLSTQRARVPEIEHDWCWGLEFSPDGKWLFARSRKGLLVRSAETGEIAAGPFRYDLIERDFAYQPETQRLISVELNSEKDDEWQSELVVYSGKTWTEEHRITMPGHAREVHWLDKMNLLVVSDRKGAERTAPYTYDKNTLTLVSLTDVKPATSIVARHQWMRDLAVGGEGHFILTTRDWTRCWKLGDKQPLWTTQSNYRASMGHGNWVLLHKGKTAVICTLDSGDELQRWDNVSATRRDGDSIWLCRDGSVEVWEARAR